MNCTACCGFITSRLQISASEHKMKFIKRSERDMEHFKEFVEIP